MIRTRTVDTVMADARAAAFKTRSVKGGAKRAGLLLAVSMVDLTTLEGKDSPEKVRALCRKAMAPGDGHEFRDLGAPVPRAAAVCVYPSMVPVAAEALAGSGVKVASVATGFPSGQYPLGVRLRDCEEAVRGGADEIDMVINRGALLAGRHDEVAREIREFKGVCAAGSSPERPVHLKVILETGELETYDLVRRASDLAIGALLADGGRGPAGTGFIKTSTGKVQPAATMPVTLVMLEAIRDAYLSTGLMVGMKPAGGIRAAKEAIHYLVMLRETLGDRWLSPDWFRFGASTLLNDLLRQLARLDTGGYAARYDFAEA